MTPVLNEGEYVFCSVSDIGLVDLEDTIGTFREKEGISVILKRSKADELHLQYDYVSSWITLQVHSSLEAVGLTAAFSTELANNDISCNVLAGYYHDHIFVDQKAAKKALEVLNKLSDRQP